MSGVFLSDAELDALIGVSWPARCLYIYCLRRRVDFASGVVGRTYRLSWQMFREHLEYIPPPTSNTEKVIWTPGKLRQLLVELARVDVIESVACGEEKLVFKLNIAAAGLVRVREAQRAAPHEAKHEAPRDSVAPDSSPKVLKLQVVSGGCGKPQSMKAQRGMEREAKPEAQHTSRNNTNTTDTYCASGEISSGVAGPKKQVGQWEPADDVWVMLSAQGVDSEFAKAKLAEYCLYWSDRGHERSSWDAHFFNHCMRQWRRYGHEWAPCGDAVRTDRGGRSAGLGFIEKHTDRTWADGLGDEQ